MTSALLVAFALHADPTPPTFTVDATSGSLTAIDKAWLVKVDDQPPVAFQQLRQTSQNLPPFPTTGVILANGDRIPGTFLGGDDSAIRLKSSLVAAGLRVPLPSVRVVWLTPVPADMPMFVDRYSWLDSPQKQDVLLLRNGDRRTGDIERFEEASVRLKSVSQSATIQIDSIAAIAFNPNLNAIRKVKGAYAHATLADGSRLTLTSASTIDGSIRATLASGGTIHFPIADLMALTMQQNGAVELSSLTPKVVVEPFGDWAWPLGIDRGVKGEPLTLRDANGVSTFRTGLGMHPKMRLTFPLNGRYASLESQVGLDAITGRRGVVSVRIRVDGVAHTVHAGKPLTLANGPVPVRVPLANAKELTLEVDFAGVGDVQADVTWADARLIELKR